MAKFTVNGQARFIAKDGRLLAEEDRAVHAPEQPKPTIEEAEYGELMNAATELVRSENFIKVITKGYIDYVALETGKTFSGSDSEIDSLKAVTHLQNYLNSLTEG